MPRQNTPDGQGDRPAHGAVEQISSILAFLLLATNALVMLQVVTRFAGTLAVSANHQYSRVEQLESIIPIDTFLDVYLLLAFAVLGTVAPISALGSLAIHMMLFNHNNLLIYCVISLLMAFCSIISATLSHRLYRAANSLRANKVRDLHIVWRPSATALLLVLTIASLTLSIISLYFALIYNLLARCAAHGLDTQRQEYMDAMVSMGYWEDRRARQAPDSTRDNNSTLPGSFDEGQKWQRKSSASPKPETSERENKRNPDPKQNPDPKSTPKPDPEPQPKPDPKPKPKPEPKPKPKPEPIPAPFKHPYEKHYARLGIPLGSSMREVKQAYRKLAREHHPDKNLGNEREAAERFKGIKDAYDGLTDPERLRRRR